MQDAVVVKISISSLTQTNGQIAIATMHQEEHRVVLVEWAFPPYLEQKSPKYHESSNHRCQNRHF